MVVPDPARVPDTQDEEIVDSNDSSGGLVVLAVAWDLARIPQDDGCTPVTAAGQFSVSLS